MDGSSSRGLGVARRVIGTIEARRDAPACRRFASTPTEALKEAQALYRKLGYREIARFNANPYAHHWFEKRL